MERNCGKFLGSRISSERRRGRGGAELIGGWQKDLEQVNMTPNKCFLSFCVMSRSLGNLGQRLCSVSDLLLRGRGRGHQYNIIIALMNPANLCIDFVIDIPIQST